MYFGCDLSIEESVKDFEKLGYTHEESIERAKAAIQPVTINPEIGWDEIVEAFNAIGCTSFNHTSLTDGERRAWKRKELKKY